MRRAVSGILLILLMTSMLTLALNIQSVKAATVTIIVPDDYPTIQEAINNANEGDTIFVRNGTYYENPIVRSSISLVGENNSNTTVDGRGIGPVIDLSANNARINGFTIRNGGEFPDSSIRINGSGNLVEQNIVTGSFYGVIFQFSSNNSLIGNRIFNNKYGVRLDSSPDNSISGNRIEDNVDYGIFVQNCPLSTISGNNMRKNSRGIFLYESSDSTISGNNLAADFEYGIRLGYSSNSGIVNNSITGNNYGGSEGYGICLFAGADFNTITGNSMESNNYGIRLRDGSDLNSITRNTIVANNLGILVDWAGGNSIYHNNIVNNREQVQSIGDVQNFWDNGCEGNYWSNYHGSDLDNDGVGDTELPWEGVDSCPLMNPYWIPADVNHDLIVDILDVVKVTASYNSTLLDPEWNPHSDIAEPYGTIDIFDVVTCTAHYEETWP